MKTYFVELSPDEVIDALKRAASRNCDVFVGGHQMILQLKMPLAGLTISGRASATNVLKAVSVVIEVKPAPSGSFVTVLKDKKRISSLYIWLGFMLITGITALIVFILRGTLIWNSASDQKMAALVIGSLIIFIAIDKDKSSQRTKLIRGIETALAKQKGFKILDDNDKELSNTKDTTATNSEFND